MISMFCTGCLTASPFHMQRAESPEFRPQSFFAGRTTGTGVLVQRGKRPRHVHVAGVGTEEAEGSFRLDQVVTYDDGSIEHRTWTLRQLSDHTYTGSLTDATGPVAAESLGNTFSLRYPLGKPWISMHQTLVLQPDGRTVLNVATVTVLGIPWARLSETITRDDSAVATP